MSRLLTIVAALCLAAGCHSDKGPQQPAPSEVPLPPASGTAVGYLIDNAGALELKEDQLDKLKQIDVSLASKNETLEVQMREIEQPEEPDEPPDKHETVLKPKNWAPGATAVHTTQDSGKLHDAHAQNTQEALTQAFAVLDASQQKTALRLLADRGIKGPKTTTVKTTTSDGVSTETKTERGDGGDGSDTSEAPRGEP
ncbi:MAG TPA: hypothetical protein VGM90_13050 [Kofleriaceae bacterium]|jgi:hypothetical protein